MNGNEFSRVWFDFSFNNPNKAKPVHTAIYFFAIDLAMEALGICNYKTYIKALQDLVDWGFIKWIQISRNQYNTNIIALAKNTTAPHKILDKA